MKDSITFNECIGDEPSSPAAILNSPIPLKRFGRNLTSAECRALRKLGWSVSERYVVIRGVTDIDSFGTVYYPAEGNGYYNACIYVQTK